MAKEDTNKDKPKRYDPKEAEARWMAGWEKNLIYKFNPDSKKKIFSIDTPPPTMSGKMHIGHAFSYTQGDFIARYKRMRGYNVFYPFGTDDNGIPTELLMEKMHKIRAVSMQRAEFVKLTLETLDKLRPDFVQDWKDLGISCDFSIFYSTINDHCRRINQESFLDLYRKGREYRKDAPALYCPRCQTAISQVECDDEELPSTFNDIVFKITDSKGNKEDVIIATTRPEYLPACVAVFYHPDDERYKRYKGAKAIVPISGHEVPVLEDQRVIPDKGTGIMMCCTFGDQMDMEWYFAYNLPLRDLLNRDGTLKEIAGKYAGMKVKDARKAILDDLKEHKLLINQKPIQHPVKVHERCRSEIEIVHTKQWFIKYLDIKEDMLDWGAELHWYPKHMKTRYDHWVKGLQWDWLISRQRFFGVPFPVWYCNHCNEIITARKEDLPVDPTRDKPPVQKCPKCGGSDIIPETDIQDTWATSSLTPQITTELFRNHPIYKKLYPMDLRLQAHDIISFWLFNTVVKSRLHNDVNPWRDVVISGHALDPSGKKMSKSKGNIVVPQEMMEKHSADALRFWAAGTKLGDDMPFQEKDLVTGGKFITKLWNAASFCFTHLDNHHYAHDPGFAKDPRDLRMIDRWLLSKLNTVIKEATEAFERYEYSRTRAETEKFFWHVFCDYYLEIVKDRLYNPDGFSKADVRSALFCLHTALLSVLKLMAPVMPFITEEVYHMHFAGKEKDAEENPIRSLHLSSWPEYDENLAFPDAEKAGELVCSVIADVRRAKTEKNVSQKTPVKSILVRAKLAQADFDMVMADIKGAINAENISYEELADKSGIDYESVIEL